MTVEPVVVCPKCLEEFKKWAIIQAHKDGGKTKWRQTTAYQLWDRLDRMIDIKVEV
jgi:hypothetical protein